MSLEFRMLQNNTYKMSNLDGNLALYAEHNGQHIRCIASEELLEDQFHSTATTLNDADLELLIGWFIKCFSEEKLASPQDGFNGLDFILQNNMVPSTNLTTRSFR